MRGRGALVLAVALAACSRQAEKNDFPPRPTSSASPAAATAAVADNHIRCALDGARDFKPDCTREVARGPDGEIWIIRHPDGGFRRFVLIDGGTRIATADGSQEVRAKRVGPDLDVRVANEGYLFPAAPDARTASAPPS